MNSNRKNAIVFFGVGIPAAAVCIVFLLAAGVSDDRLGMLLRLTARLSFMIFLLVFVARPLRQLVRTPLTTWLVRERRSLGIAFAAMHSVHLGLIAFRFSTIPGLEYPTSNALIGGTAYLLMYLMLITSFDVPARSIGARSWRRLHKTGLYFIGFIFVATLLPYPGEPIFTLERAWFVTLTVLAVFVRLTAWFAVRKARSTL